MSSTKLESLRALIRSYESCLVAYSGGVDSAFLGLIASQELGAKALCVIADSPSLPRRELEEALEVARKFAMPVEVVRTAEMENSSYLENPGNRCFFCKQELFLRLIPMARERGLKVVAYGENASDIGDHRPGAIAAAQFRVTAPLKEAGLTKDEIRAFSAELGLPTADKPQMPCLSSRIPYGEKVTVKKLGMIEQAEAILQDFGFADVRVRHHELPANAHSSASFLARIELPAGDFGKFALVATEAAARVKAVGYAHVTLDLAGYRRGALNQALAEAVEQGRA